MIATLGEDYIPLCLSCGDIFTYLYGLCLIITAIGQCQLSIVHYHSLP